MLIPSDTSDISDWEWIAGGFPNRDMIRDRIISDNIREPKPYIPPPDSHTARDNIKTEILDGQASSSDPLDCPISIIPAGRSRTQLPLITPSRTTIEAKQPDYPPDKQKTSQKDATVGFPIYEITDSSEKNAAVQESSNNNNITGNEFELRRSWRNVGPPLLRHYRLSRRTVGISDKPDHPRPSFKIWLGRSDFIPNSFR